MIKFMNGRTQYELITMGVNDRTSIIMEANDFHTKRELITISTNKFNSISQHSQCFRDKCNPSIKLGFPSPWTNDSWFYSPKIYTE